MSSYWLAHLDQSQKEIILNHNPILCLAGPGTGKTTLIIEKILYLIKERNIKPERILVFAFNNKLKNIIKHKILKHNIVFENVHTFNTFCASFLRTEYNYLNGFDADFNIFDKEDVLDVCKMLVKNYFKDRYMAFVLEPASLKEMLSSLKTNPDYKIPEKYLDFLPFLSTLYKTKLLEYNALDFDDLSIETLEILSQDPSVLARYQNSYDYIFVDDFEELTLIQYEIIKLISKKSEVFVAGDPDESIYSSRGAAPELFSRFLADFNNVSQISLSKNFRSSSSVLSVANDFILNNDSQHKVLVSDNTQDFTPIFKDFNDLRIELNYISDNIKSLRDVNRNEIAILIRSEDLAETLIEHFTNQKIKYKLVSSNNLFQLPEVKDIISFLRLSLFYSDNYSFERVINVPKRRFGEINFSETKKISKEKKIPYFEAIHYLYDTNIGISNARNLYVSLKTLANIINELTFDEILERILSITNYYKAIPEYCLIERQENIKSFFSFLERKVKETKLNNLDGIRHFLLNLALFTTLEEDTDIDAVNILTYHNSKGLEFDTVFMPFMLEGIFPPYQATINSKIEEERRVCYVGLTRCRKRLFVTKSNYKSSTRHHRVTSSFWYEAKPETEDDRRTNRKFNIYSFKYNKDNLKTDLLSDLVLSVGDKILHKAFGTGIVKSIDGDRLEISFSNSNESKIIQNNSKFIKKL